MPDSISPTSHGDCCPHCGAEVCAHDNFCLACGSAIREPRQAATAAATPPHATADAGKQPFLTTRRALLLLVLFLLGGLIGYLLTVAF